MTGPSSPASHRRPASTVGPACHPSSTRIRPPRTVNTRPVTPADSGLDNHATRGAIFPGSETSKLPGSTGRYAPGVACSVMRVRAPGLIALTVTPYWPSSAAAMMVSAAMPAFAAP